MKNTDIIIEKIIHGLSGEIDTRRAYLIRESLRSLVRLAQAEYRCQVKRSVSILAGQSGNGIEKRNRKSPAE